MSILEHLIFLGDFGSHLHVHNQIEKSSHWFVEHNFGTNDIYVFAEDKDGVRFHPAYDVEDLNTIQIHVNPSMVGKAYILKLGGDVNAV
jgi:hypothetical protein